MDRDRDDVETEEERKRRLSRPVRLPRITAPPRCQDNVSREVWGTSYIAQESPFAQFKMERGRYTPRRASPVEGTKIVNERETDTRWADNKERKDSVKMIVFAIAALVAVVFALKWATPAAES